MYYDHENIQEAVLYGSRAKGPHNAGSDIDLCLKDADISLPELRRIETEVGDLLLTYKTDLSVYHMLDKPELIAHIQQAGQIIYSKI